MHWVTELVEYHFVLHHKPGTLNKKADLLSHRNDHDQGKDDNGDIVVLQPAHFRALIMPTTNKVHTKIEEATRQEELWDEGIKTSLAHERGVSREGGALEIRRTHLRTAPSRALR